MWGNQAFKCLSWRLKCFFCFCFCLDLSLFFFFHPFIFFPFCIFYFPLLFILGSLLWLALVWLYYPSHAFGGAGLSCVVASRFAQNWHFSCPQKAYGEALVCTRMFVFILHALVHLQSTKTSPPNHPIAWSRWFRVFSTCLGWTAFWALCSTKLWLVQEFAAVDLLNQAHFRWCYIVHISFPAFRFLNRKMVNLLQRWAGVTWLHLIVVCATHCIIRLTVEKAFMKWLNLPVAHKRDMVLFSLVFNKCTANLVSTLCFVWLLCF